MHNYMKDICGVIVLMTSAIFMKKAKLIIVKGLLFNNYH